MLKCPYNNSCIKPQCDLACSKFSELEHWFNRCGLNLSNPAIVADKLKIAEADSLIQKAIKDDFGESSYAHISVYSGEKAPLVADVVTYLAICKYCKDSGLYNGVYKLNFAQYLEEIKQSWNTRYNSKHLDDMKIWSISSKFLIIYNLGLVRFGDFESQTLLSLFQERYDTEKYTIVILESGKYILPGKQDSMFYHKLKNELSAKGVRV